MPETNPLWIFLGRLEGSGLRYMLTGAAASIIYGEPRLTHDVDLVVEMSQQEVVQIVRFFPSDEFYCPPVEVLESEAKRPLRGHFYIIHHASGFKADFYLMGKDELHRWAMAGRKRIEMDGWSIWVAPPEYVILRKLEYYREGRSEKHLRDIAGMLAISEESIDTESLRQRIEEYGLGREWDAVQKQRDQ
jgi:hypothetical protein